MKPEDEIFYKEKILRTLATNPNGMNNTTLASRTFQNKVTPREVWKLLQEIKDHDNHLIDIDERKDYVVAKTEKDYALKFLKNGGFSKVLFREGVELMVSQEKEQLERENLELNNRLSKQKLKTHWIPIIVSLLGLFIALASYFKPSNEPSEPVDDTRLRNIETKIEQLEEGLKKDLDSLQNELYEAQMLIDTYES